MAKKDLTKELIEVLTGNDGIIVRKHLTGVEAGRNLDVTNYNEETIPAGLVVITDGKGRYKPIVPVVTEGVPTYTLPNGWSYFGIVECSTLKTKSVAILTGGLVNENVLPYPITAEIKTALSHIQFMKDEAEPIPED